MSCNSSSDTEPGPPRRGTEQSLIHLGDTPFTSSPWMQHTDGYISWPKQAELLQETVESRTLSEIRRASGFGDRHVHVSPGRRDCKVIMNAGRSVLHTADSLHSDLQALPSLVSNSSATFRQIHIKHSLFYSFYCSSLYSVLFFDNRRVENSSHAFMQSQLN